MTPRYSTLEHAPRSSDIPTPDHMKIGELSAQTGLSRDALRFYEKRGLLRSTRGSNGYREYPLEAVEWLGYIRMAQGLGFSLAEIEADLPLLNAARGNGDQAPQQTDAALRELLHSKLASIDARIAGLGALRAQLAERLATTTLACPLAA